MTHKPPLAVAGRDVRNIFDLLGRSEDSISLAIAWALANSPQFFRTFLARCSSSPEDTGCSDIRIHRHEAGGGITDIEILVGGALHLIIEAKRGWVLPSKEQLEMYAHRKSFQTGAAKVRKILTLSECSQAYAKVHLPVSRIGAVPVEHVSWSQIISDCLTADRASGHAEKRLLRELIAYLRSAMTMQDRSSNLVFVVSLSTKTEPGWKTSWIDIVEKFSRYFHPVGDRWPGNPPNYVGFRYHGQLQTIHHVEKYEVIDNLKDACPGIADSPVPPHYLYHLGPPIRPAHPVRTGNLWPSGRHWCAIDLLLTSSSVSDARDATQKRDAT